MEKIKNLPVMRFVAFAVALAIILGLSSVMLSFTVSAETADSTVSQLGTLGNYDCIKFNYNSAVSVRAVVNKFNSYGTGKYVYGAVFGYKDGSFVQYTNNAINYCVGVDKIIFNSTGFFPSWLDNDIYSNSEFIFTESSNSKACSTYRYSTDDGYKYGSMTACAGNLSLSEFINTYGDTFYAVFTSSSTGWTTQQLNAFKSDVMSNLNASKFKSEASASIPRGEFVSCKSAPSGYPEGVLWFEDWIKQGMQYPYFTWYIRDNGNKHSYSVKFSYNCTQVDICDKVFNNRFYDELENVKQNPLLLFAESGVVFAASKLKWLAEQVGLIENITAIQWKNLSYTDSFVLSSIDMDFTSSDNNGNKVFSVCLSDYSDIGRYFIYRAEIIDNVTGNVLDTTYFCPLNKFAKGSSGYGSKIYDYGDNGDGMLDDLINNTPSVNPNIKDNFTVNGNFIGDDIITGNLANIDISSIYSTLVSSANSVGAFFNACMTIIPPAFISIILTGLSLVIILRVLGR